MKKNMMALILMLCMALTMIPDALAAADQEYVTKDNLATIDFTQEVTTFEFSGTFDNIVINELGQGSIIKFDNATVGALQINDDATLTGEATIASFSAVRNSADPIEIAVSNADFDIAGDVNVKNSLGQSVLNITNSSFECAFLFVGEHTNNCRSASAEFNVVNSYLRCEENSMGSTIAVWGRSGVKATIYDSEIHTYSRGWHQNEDMNDNAITFQGAANIDVDIQRSNIHTYGYRSIINARKYGSEATVINTNMEDSLIWVVTKSQHASDTIPVWGFDNSIKDTALVFTKNVSSGPYVDSSYIYGNPVIHGDFKLHSACNCSWDAHAVLEENQTITFAKNADISVDDGCNGSLNFVLPASAQIVIEEGAKVSGKIRFVDENHVPLYTAIENGNTIYRVGNPVPLPSHVNPAKIQNVFVYAGDTATMSVTATDATSYQWYIDRGDGRGYVIIDGATGASYTTSAVDFENDGDKYYCVVEYGSVSSPEFTLNVMKYADIPTTGDNSDIGLWIALLAIALVGMVACSGMCQRRREID